MRGRRTSLSSLHPSLVEEESYRWRFALLRFGLPRPPLEKLGCPFLSAEPEGKSERERNRSENDEEGDANDVAEAEMIDGDHDDEDQDCVHRHPAEHVGVGHLQIATIGGDRHTDEARKIGAKRNDDDSHDDLGYEQDDAANQLRDRDQPY